MLLKIIDNSLYWVIPLVLTIRFLSFIISKIYAGIVRYTGTRDTERILIIIFSGTILLTIINFLSRFVSGIYLIPFSVLGIDLLSNVFLMTAFRLFVKAVYFEYSRNTKQKKNVIIYGISDIALIAKRTLVKDIDSNYKVVAFIDDDRAGAGKKLDGLNIFNTDKLVRVLEYYDVSILIFAR